MKYYSFVICLIMLCGAACHQRASDNAAALGKAAIASLAREHGASFAWVAKLSEIESREKPAWSVELQEIFMADTIHPIGFIGICEDVVVDSTEMWVHFTSERAGYPGEAELVNPPSFWLRCDSSMFSKLREDYVRSDTAHYVVAAKLKRAERGSIGEAVATGTCIHVSRYAPSTDN